MRLTVLQTLPALEVGGVERGTLEIARGLVERGHRSIVISAGGRLRQRLCDEGSEHYNWPIGRKSLATLALVIRLAHFVRENGIDVLHSRSRLPAWISWLALKKLKVATAPAFITTVHGVYSVNRYSQIMTAGDKVIAISNYIRDYIAQNYKHTDMGKVRLIHRGVDRAAYPFGYQPESGWLTNWRQAYPHLQDKQLITLPGRITRRKGHEDFIGIIGRLVEQGRPVHGLIAGGAHPKKRPFMRALQDAVQQRGLQRHISFIGHRDDMREVMAVSDIVLSLARTPEAFGRTSLEALSLGVPVIAYDHGGAAEVLSALQPAGLVPAHDAGGAAQAIVAFLRRPPAIRPEHVFTLENMVGQTIAAYEQLHGTRRPARP